MCCHSGSCRPTGLLAWIASWLTFGISPVLALLLGGISFFQSFPSALRLTRATILSPFVLVPLFIAWKAMDDYRDGHAVVYRLAACPGSGDTLTDNASVDAATRLPIADPPRKCGGFLTLRVYNKVVKFLSRKFGPQKGAWSGYFPSETTARLALKERGEEAPSEIVTQFPDLFAVAARGPELGSISSTWWTPPPVMVVNIRGTISALGYQDFILVYDESTGREIVRYGELIPSPR